MDAVAVHQALGAMIQTQPDKRNRDELLRWLGRAQALVRKVSPSWAIEIQSISAVKLRHYPNVAIEEVCGVIYRAIATIELELPVQSHGAFIQAGNELDAYAGASKVIKLAHHTLRIVDPYMDEMAPIDYAVLANDGVAIELLSDKATVYGSFRPAVDRFRIQFANTRKLDARLTSPKQLHDRLLIIDGRDVFTISQSLKDLAKRSHALINRVEPELASLKIPAYEQYWQDATPL